MHYVRSFRCIAAFLTLTQLPAALATECPGTNVVTTCTDANLRTAIEAGGLVTLCCNGTILLTNTIRVSREVALDATGHEVIISGGQTIRLFEVDAGVHFSVTNLVLADGAHSGASRFPPPGEPGRGGAIFNDGGTVALVGSVLRNNRAQGAQQATAAGGAIFSRNGSVFLLGTSLSNNAALGGVGEYPAPGGDAFGGAVYSEIGSVVVINTILSNNLCRVEYGGGRGAGAKAYGGAMFQSSGQLSISNTTFAANNALGGNTPIWGDQSRPGNAYGGAIAVASGDVLIKHSTFTSNSAAGGNAWRFSGTGEAKGGALFNSGRLVATDSSFRENLAASGSGSSVNTDGRGGALHNDGFVVLERCAIHSNVARGASAGFFSLGTYSGGHGLGGGVFNTGQLATTNSSYFLNSALGGAAGGTFSDGFPGAGLGGGIYNDAGGTVDAMNITVASNTVIAGQSRNFAGVAAGSGIATLSNGTVRLRNTILAATGTNGNGWGPITDGGFNISSDNSIPLYSGTSISSMDPRLASPANNGGPTLTLALLPGSPAIDAGTDMGAPTVDQRGFSRPIGGGIDMGAYEDASPGRLYLSYEHNTESLTLIFTLPAGLGCSVQSYSPDVPQWTEVEFIPASPEAQPIRRTYSFVDVAARLFRLH